MKKENIIEIPAENIEIIENNDYKNNVKKCFFNLPDVAQVIVSGANNSLKKIENILYTTPSFINLIKATIPEVSYQAILSNRQKNEIAKGAIKLMSRKDGSLMANLIDTKTNKIIETISLKKLNITPELSHAINDFTMQMQMAQIAEQIQVINFAIEEVKQGQEYDRLATAYSCQQKLLQIMSFNNKDLKTNDIISISKQIISAMKLCDERGLYHGAFRLDNVFIDKDYNIKIYDLGITKANGGVNIRMNNNIAFLCPHQLNVNYTDKESDFFAIGIIMYYCLFKKMPFKIGVNDREMLKNIDKGIDLNKDRTTALSKGLVDIIKKLLARKNKYSSYSEILIDLTKIMYVNADIVETKNTEYDEGIYIQHKKSNSFMIKLISIIMCAVVLVIVIAQL